MRAWLQLSVLGSAAAAIASCNGAAPEQTPRCGEETAIYEQRIKPLFEQEQPQSCNQCHLSGIDLALFDRGNACDTMACMVEQGLVDLDDPESSRILSWIDRAAPESEGITEDVIAAEREGFLEWIRMTADCGTCSTSEQPCGGEGDRHEDCDFEAIEKEDPDAVIAADTGGCSDLELERLFMSTFFPRRGRCFPCHFADVDGVEEAPKWVGVGDCEIASLTTYRNVTEAGYIDVEEPSKSRWLLKPLEASLGGIDHGGGPKIHDTEEDLYRMMLYFAERYADCKR